MEAAPATHSAMPQPLTPAHPWALSPKGTHSDPRTDQSTLAPRACGRKREAKSVIGFFSGGVQRPSSAHTPCTRVFAGVSRSPFEPLSESNEGNEGPLLVLSKEKPESGEHGLLRRCWDRDAAEGRALCPKTPNLLASQRSRLLAALTPALRFSQPTKAGPGTRAGGVGSSTEAGGVGVAPENAHLPPQSEAAGPA